MPQTTTTAPAPAGALDHAIKFRRKGDRAWWFCKPNGAATRLRVHAARFTKQRAGEVMAEDIKHNPDLEFKVVKL